MSGPVRMNGGEAVVATLREHGVLDVFGIVASSILEIFNLLPAAGLRYVGVRHEQIAAHMADGYARIAGRPAVCLVQNGGGVTNLATGFATALQAHTPIIGISGTPATSELDRDAFQEMDQLALMRPVTKWARRVASAARISEYVAAAVKEATTAPMAPVFLEIPRDFLYEVNDVEIVRERSAPATGKMAPDAGTARLVADLLAAAEFPVILAGGGVVWSNAEADVCQLAEELAAPICTSYQHNDAAPSSHPWVLGSLGRAGSRAAMNAIARSDCVFAVGTRLAGFSLMPYWGLNYFPPDATIVQVDVDPARIGANRPVTLGVVADAGEAVRTVRAALTQRPRSSRWSSEDVRQLRLDEERVLMTQVESRGPLRTEDAFIALRDVIPRDAIVVTDVGGTPSFAFHMLKFEHPRSLVSPLLFGSLGFALGAAMGAKLAAPRRPVLALLGDGALTMSLPALVTASEYEIPFVAVVFDNACWGAELVNQKFFNDGHYVGTLLKNPDLRAAASALGCEAYAAADADELREGVAAALASGRPAVVVVSVDPASLPEPARKDVLQVPFRGLFAEHA